MARHNQLSPAPSFPERARAVYEAAEAQNPRRQGPRQAEEQLVQRDGSLYQSFAGGRAPEAGVYEVKLADGPSSLADGSAATRGPTWDAVPTGDLRSFARAMDFGEPGEAGPLPRSPRPPGSGNPNTITPLAGLARGSRQNTAFGSKIARDGRWRRNVADVTTVLD